MEDLITQAVDGSSLNEERRAEGSYDGADVELKKLKYRTLESKSIWRLIVHVNGSEEVAKQKDDLSAKEADQEFIRLVENHDLEEISK
jgi:hypothetical protein